MSFSRFYEDGKIISKRTKKSIKNSSIIEELGAEYKSKKISLQTYLFRLSKVTYISL